MVFGGEPEQWDDRPAQVFLEASGQADGRQCLVEGEQWAAEEARLLPREHGKALRGAQVFDALADDVRGIPGSLLALEHGAQGVAGIGTGVAAFHLRAVRAGRVGIVRIEWGEARERMDVIPSQGGISWNLPNIQPDHGHPFWRWLG
jgi:hypothetical protein